MDNQWNTTAESPLSALCNIEAEQCLLGAILINNNAFEYVADVVAAEDFGNPVHGLIYSEIGKLVAQGMPANPITLSPLAQREAAIGSRYLVSLLEAAPTVINAPHYANIIVDMARRREIVCVAQDAIADATVIDPDRPADTVLDEVEERLYSIGDKCIKNDGLVSLGTIIAGTLQKIEAAHKSGGAITVDTGLVDLDRIISGMGAGDLSVIAGRPSMGKSALAGSIAVNAAKAGKKVAMFSLEMSREELSQRWIAGLTGISTDRQRHGQIDDKTEWDKLVEASNYLNTLPILVDDQARLSVAQMRQRARRIRRRGGLDLIIIDHLQLIRQGGKQESRRLEIGDATSMLKAIAKEMRLPILLLSQLNRGVESRENKRPGLADLKESGDIEQDADLVMFLYRDEYYLLRNEPRHKQGQSREAFTSEVADWQEKCSAAHGIAEIEVAKNRHGKTGMVRVRFDGERQRFENLERRW